MVRRWSRFSAPNFRLPDSFLGNIGEDLQDGHEPTDDDVDGDEEADVMSLNAHGSLEATLGETFSAPGSMGPRPTSAAAEVSARIHSGSNTCDRLSIHIGRFLTWPIELWSTYWPRQGKQSTCVAEYTRKSPDSISRMAADHPSPELDHHTH